MFKLFLVLTFATCVLGLNPGRVRRDKPEEYDYSILISHIVGAICAHNGLEQNKDNAEKHIRKFNTYLNVFVDSFTNYDAEVEEAKVNGTLSETIKKYCGKFPPLKAEFYKMLDGIKPCLSAPEIEFFTGITNVYARLLDFVCLNDGSWITKLYNADWEAAYKENKSKVKACNRIYNEKFMKSLETMLKDEEQCGIFDEYVTCAAKAFEEFRNGAVSTVIREMQAAWMCA